MSPDTVESTFSDLVVQGTHRRFVVCRMGQTGSAWLSKLLNSHPDVYCEHESIISKIYPKAHPVREDQINFVKWMAHDTKHYAYQAVGDIGSLDMDLALELPREHFTVGLLLRHPVMQIQTRLNDLQESPPDPDNDDNLRQMEAYINEVFGIDPSQYDLTDRLFLIVSWLWYCQMQNAREVNCVLRIEDIAQVKSAQESLLQLTGLEYDSQIIKNVMKSSDDHLIVTAESTKDAFNQFSDRQRQWYKKMIHDFAEKIGYTL